MTGEVAAFRALLERWFDSCVDVAWQVLHDADAAAGVAQDTFFAAWHAGTARKPSAEAGAWVLRASRDGALGRLAQARHQAPDGDRWPSSGAPAVRGNDRDAGADLLRAASAALGEADASVLDLHLRHGFGVAELAQALGVARHDAQELVLRLNRRLGRALRAWKLWPDARPGATSGCADLRVALESNGVRAFGPEAVTEIARHAKACERCQDRQRLSDTPEAQYAAVPVVPAGTMLATAALAALADRGIPLGVEGPAATAPEAHAPPAAPPSAGVGGPPVAAPPAATATAAASGGTARPAPPSPPPAPPVPPWPPAPTDGPAAAGTTTASGTTPGALSPRAAASTSSAGARPPTALAAGALPPAALAAGAPTGVLPAPPAGSGEGAGGAPTSGAYAGTHFRGGVGAGSRSGEGPPARPPRRGRRVAIVLAILAVLALGAGAAVALGGGDDGGDRAGPTTTRPPAGTSSTTERPEKTTTTDASGTTSTTTVTPTTAGTGGTTTTAATTTTTAATGEPPKVVDFAVASVSLGRPCDAADRRITLQWQVSGADSVTLSGEGAPAGSHPTAGQATACRVSGPPVTYTLTATGPGGTGTATVSA